MKQTTEIIGTMDISQSIEMLIKSSYMNIFFVSPYLRITDRLKGLLASKLIDMDKCFFIFRQDMLTAHEKTWISSFKNIRLVEVKNLHAKLYFNESECILTSMNFYEYSQINNYEIGVKFRRQESPANYDDIIKQVKLMVQNSPNNEEILLALEAEQDFSAIKLFTILSNKNKMLKYDEFSRKAMEIVEFDLQELYLDKSAILRSTQLGSERFRKIFSSLK